MIILIYNNIIIISSFYINQGNILFTNNTGSEWEITVVKF